MVALTPTSKGGARPAADRPAIRLERSWLFHTGDLRARRIIEGALDARLIAVDAATGAPWKRRWAMRWWPALPR